RTPCTVCAHLCSSMTQRTTRPTLFPYTTLFRSSRRTIGISCVEMNFQIALNAGWMAFFHSHVARFAIHPKTCLMPGHSVPFIQAHVTCAAFLIPRHALFTILRNFSECL